MKSKAKIPQMNVSDAQKMTRNSLNDQYQANVKRMAEAIYDAAISGQYGTAITTPNLYVAELIAEHYKNLGYEANAVEETRYSNATRVYVNWMTPEQREKEKAEIDRRYTLRT
jgi:hypothetical protein